MCDEVKEPTSPPLLSAAGTNPLQLRVKDGLSPCAGRVEVQYNTTWYSICSSGWSLLEAEVACKQLGCGPAQSVPTGAHFSREHHRAFLEGLSCRGTESLLLECQRSKISPGPCRNGATAGVVCSEPKGECPELPMGTGSVGGEAGLTVRIKWKGSALHAASREAELLLHRGLPTRRESSMVLAPEWCMQPWRGYFTAKGEIQRLGHVFV